ncbi:hypothetical protein EAO72_25215 [Streptomyces sp. or43]|nr:hypothetical protein EAO72_25215 [Streptomyces sp. or43]
MFRPFRPNCPVNISRYSFPEWVPTSACNRESAPDEWLPGLKGCRAGALWHACPVFGSDSAYGGVRDER